MASQNWETYQISDFVTGLDLKRSQYTEDFGNWYALETTTFRAGMLVGLDANQNVVRSVGTHVLGFAKASKSTTIYAYVVGEYIQLNALVATTLANANLLTAAGGAAGVRVAAALTGAAYTEGAFNDYTVNYVNGTVVRVGGSAIPDGGYVYVNYAYQMTAAEIEREGHNFWNYDNDVTIQDNRVTVIQAPAAIFTSQYDPSRTYAVEDAVYAGVTGELLEGLVTTSNTGQYIGRVLQVPTPSDPFLGIRFMGTDAP